MPCTLSDLAEMLDRDRWPYLLDPAGQRLICQGRGARGRFDLEFRVSEQGQCVHFRIPRVAVVGDSPHLAPLAVALLGLHYRIKLGRFGYDPSDGEVDCEIILPLEDLPLTYRVFRRCVGTLLMLAEQQRDRLAAILATGHDPEADQEAAADNFLDQLAALLGVTRETLDAHLPPGPDSQQH